MKKTNLTDLLAGLAGMLFFLTLSVTLALNARFLYYADVPSLSAATGYSEEEIRENYDALIDYNSILSHEELLTFPSLPMSEHAQIHFYEVKRIFVGMEYVCILSGALFLCAAVYLLRRRRPVFLFWTWLLGTFVPLLAGGLALWNWDRLFTAFHRAVFSNDYWLFDPATDPIIDLLPDSFFFRCLLLIAAMMLALTQGCGLFWLRKKAKAGRPAR